MITDQHMDSILLSWDKTYFKQNTWLVIAVIVVDAIAVMAHLTDLWNQFFSA